MLEDFGSQPDDTVEIQAVAARRPVGLIVAAVIIAVAVLVGVGFLAFGSLGGGGGATASSPGLPAVSPSTDTVPASPTPEPSSPSPTPTVSATPIAAPTPSATTPSGTPTTPATVTLSIANATMQPPSYEGAQCPGATTGVVTVTTNGPVTITYEWASTQAAAPVSNQSYAFRSAGSHQFTHAFTGITTPNGRLVATFVVRTPVQRRASMTYTQTCGARPSKVSFKIMHPAPGQCAITFSSMLTAGVGPMIVTSHWKIDRPVAAPSHARWSVPAGGDSKPSTITVGGIARKATVTAQLIVDTPIRAETAIVAATCK